MFLSRVSISLPGADPLELCQRLGFVASVAAIAIAYFPVLEEKARPPS
jgi:hypothetical protein